MDSQHYFSEQPSGTAVRRPLEVVLNGKERQLQTTSGIFSPGGVDKGTAVLLSEVPDPPLRGNLLDIGCGWGPLALTMALKSPEALITAVDVNGRSVALTTDNARALGLDNVLACKPEDVDSKTMFNTIWSNPPIRVGKEELHSLLTRWLPRLAPDGTAWLVVQKNLGADSLQRWLADELGHNWSVIRFRTAKSFRILKVTRTSAPA
ncbi:class I SAM-dependent methyltransferase [Arthrobacter roseus]|uniref:class I SAM-dependent methyltransferase n=1 Tax=Arthrobacter roseus TaxID=136274 RepID=UPI0019662F99|nr:methyltransferase [Arthrobacter roseus]MBM7848245.1 16S rRNA G1207 methylase RsmC [Arthrobacter roseus]